MKIMIQTNTLNFFLCWVDHYQKIDKYKRKNWENISVGIIYGLTERNTDGMKRIFFLHTFSIGKFIGKIIFFITNEKKITDEGFTDGSFPSVISSVN
jgi:hypothetical protein